MKCKQPHPGFELRSSILFLITVAITQCMLPLFCNAQRMLHCFCLYPKCVDQIHLSYFVYIIPKYVVLGITLNCVWLWSHFYLLSLQGSLWPRVIVPVRVSSMGWIDVWKLLVLDRNTWNPISVWKQLLNANCYLKLYNCKKRLILAWNKPTRVDIS